MILKIYEDVRSLHTKYSVILHKGLEHPWIFGIHRVGGVVLEPIPYGY
jgi:hypothetical protein